MNEKNEQASAGVASTLNIELCGLTLNDKFGVNKMAKFKQGDHVRKKSGSEWQGYIVGWYSTKLTTEGYAVESESHAGSVQIYPANALEFVNDLESKTDA